MEALIPLLIACAAMAFEAYLEPDAPAAAKAPVFLDIE